jgi:p24 family protein delta-1
MTLRQPTLLLSLLCLFVLALPSYAVKFKLEAARFPPSRCIWNTAHENALVIVTANVGPGDDQRVDIEIVDSSPKKNVYLHKRGIKGETRLAVTTHAEGEMGVCFRNFLSSGMQKSILIRFTIKPDVISRRYLFFYKET